VGSLSIGGWVLSAVVLILSCIACWEYRGLVIRKGGDPSTLGLFGGVLLLYFVQRLGAFQAGLAILILGNLILAASRYKKGSTLSNAAYAMLGALYVSLFNYLLSLRQLPTPGGNYALYAIFLTWATDISAYFIGIRWGKTPLAQALSPKKSREGAVAGLVGSALAGVCFGGFWFQWHWLRGALVGLVVGFSAQAGDLCESALKRDAGVKDAGHILPGHGGILDRFDSILFVAPVLYFLIQLFF
jgi:phosphatidate cytidylyltransferase